MFYFVVHHLRWLARVPLFPALFDGLLMTWTCLTNPARITAMEKLEEEMLQIPKVMLRVHRFGGIEFAMTDTKRELGHLHGHGLLDLRIDRAVAQSLLAARRVRPHHVLPDSGWISLQLESCEDVPFALRLLQENLDSGKEIPA